MIIKFVFFYFFQHLEKRIENFSKTTKTQLLATNPEKADYICEELHKLDEKWRNFRKQVVLKRASLNSATEFFEIVEKVSLKKKFSRKYI